MIVNPNPWQPAATSNGVDYLNNTLAPVFRTGHTLQPLGSAAIEHQPKQLIALADRWGWALQTGLNPGGPTDLIPAKGYCEFSVANAQGAPDYGYAHGSEVLRIALESGGRYKVMLSVSNMLPGQNVDSTPFVGILPENVWYNSGDPNSAATRIGGTHPTLSVLAPTAWVTDYIAKRHGECIKRFSAQYPISVIADFQEYGSGTLTQDYCALTDDPRMVELAGNPGVLGNPYPNCGTPAAGSAQQQDRDRKLPRVVGRNLAAQKQAVKAGLLSGATWRNGQPFISFYGNSYGRDRSRYSDWVGYGYWIEDEGTPKLSSAGSQEYYWRRNNTGYTGINASNTPSDMGTQLLNDVGGSIRNGVTTFYPWVSSGWGYGYPEYVSPRDRWMGFLKLMYTSGAVGALSGWFDYADQFLQQTARNAAIGTALPDWLAQYMDVAHAHALFSHLEPLVKNSDLVQGATHDGSTAHPYNQEPATSPAVPYYALKLQGEWVDGDQSYLGQGKTSPTGGPQAYVMARKIRGAQRWIITAWANVGNDRNVVATLPGYGQITVLARVAGSVYLAEIDGSGKLNLQLIDVDPMNPSALLFDSSIK